MRSKSPPAFRPRLTVLEDRTVPAAPVGSFDTVDRNGSVLGWAYDPDSPSASLSVDLYVDGGFQGRYTTTYPRSDVNAAYGIGGTHGYSVPVPAQFRNGPGHTVQVFALDAQNPQQSTYLGVKPFAEAPAFAGGHLDNVQPDGTVAGWAYDPNTPDLPINVHVYVDGQNAVATPTTVTRSDVNGALGVGGTHGFQAVIPAQYKDGRQHSVTAFAIDNSGFKGNPMLAETLKYTSPNAAFTIVSPTGVSGGGPISVSTRNDYAGAIASITWNGREFVDSRDHGRLVQSAVAARPTNAAVLAAGVPADGTAQPTPPGVPPDPNYHPFSEANYNPTEAGRYNDSTTPGGVYTAGQPSTSRIISAAQPKANQLTTAAQMAFWGTPGQMGANNTRNAYNGQDMSVNRVALSDYTTQKVVEVGAANLPANSIVIDTFVTVPPADADSFLQVSPVVAFLRGDLLSKTERYNRKLNLVDDVGPASRDVYTSTTGDNGQVDPIFASSPDGAYSIGMYNERINASQANGAYANFFNYATAVGAPDGATGLADRLLIQNSIIQQTPGGPAVSGRFQYRTYLVVGTRQDVINSLAVLAGGTPAAPDLSPQVTAVQVSSAPVPSQGGAAAKDGSLGTKWVANGVGAASGAAILYEFAAPVAVAGYLIGSGDDYPTRDPRSWVLEGSNDGANFAPIDARSDEVFSNRQVNKAILFGSNHGDNNTRTTPVAFRYYRLTVTANNGSRETSFGGTGLVQLSEFRLYGM